MEEASKDLKVGILVIGSLLWQNHSKYDAKDNTRLNWRKRHLNESRKLHVKMPIRYGRFSSGIYTMVFSKNLNLKSFGSCYVIPLKNELIDSFEVLNKEALELAAAEGMGKQFVADWGAAIGLLFNKETLSLKERNKIKLVWSQNFRDKIIDPSSYCIEKERPCITSSGILTLPWPTCIGSKGQNLLNSYDILLASATEPTKYPTIIELADNVAMDNRRFYFKENNKNRIETAQDNRVLKKLNKKNAS
jgi:hypothetical protein